MKYFFTVDTSTNPYGTPRIIQEPTLGVPCEKKAGVYDDGNIIGVLIVGESGKIEERFS